MHPTHSSGNASSVNWYVGQNPVVRTVTANSILGLRVSSSSSHFSNSFWLSFAICRSVTMPSILLVNCAPHCVLSLVRMDRSWSSLALLSKSKRLDSFLR